MYKFIRLVLNYSNIIKNKKDKKNFYYNTSGDNIYIMSQLIKEVEHFLMHYCSHSISERGHLINENSLLAAFNDIPINNLNVTYNDINDYLLKLYTFNYKNGDNFNNSTDNIIYVNQTYIVNTIINKLNKEIFKNSYKSKIVNQIILLFDNYMVWDTDRINYNKHKNSISISKNINKRLAGQSSANSGSEAANDNIKPNNSNNNNINNTVKKDGWDSDSN
tara:strand:- start:365 stop:1024 length:660 start_codon:yes stop_codon:yes gene_type:complete